MSILAPRSVHLAITEAYVMTNLAIVFAHRDSEVNTARNVRNLYYFLKAFKINL